MQRVAGVTLFLCGDVMTGRGIDQVLPTPSEPRLYEPYVRDARDYVKLAERRNGPIPKPVPFDYLWGDTLTELARVGPDARIINLETAITTSGAWEAKGINYRMHPDNAPCITAAAVDVCALANNHVLDWGYWGLEQTLSVLHQAGVQTAGAGADLREAQAPAIVPLAGGGRLLVFSLGHGSSGIPPSWAASAERAGVAILPALTEAAADAFADRVRAQRQPGDIVLASVHWGGNWGYDIPPDQRAFAHLLVERAGVDIVHGHSSHHAKGIEVYRERLVIYGCGDFINDYEGIGGYETYRGELGFMYLPTLEPHSGRLQQLRLVPTRIRNFQVHYADEEGATWLQAMLYREGRGLGTAVERLDERAFRLMWQGERA